MVKDSVLIAEVQVQSLVMRWACNQRPFAAVLQSLHLDTPLLELQNTRKLWGRPRTLLGIISSSETPELGAAWFPHFCSAPQYLDSQSLGDAIVPHCDRDPTLTTLGPRAASWPLCCRVSSCPSPCTPVMTSESANVSHLVVSDSANCSLPGSTVHGILQARILERVAISFSRGSFLPSDQTHVSCAGRQVLNHGATMQGLSSPSVQFSSIQSLSRVRLSVTP